MFYSKKRRVVTGRYILNEISHYLLFTIIVGASIFYFKNVYAKKVRVYNHLELKHNFKNCIIVGKTDTDNKYTLLLHNPILHLNSDSNVLYIDYKVRVCDYTYFYNFIGDTIK